MDMERPYTFTTLRAESREKLIAALNEDIASVVGNSVARANLPHVTFNAQLVMQELTRRDQDRQAEVMIRSTKQIRAMTFVITILTVVITVIAAIPLVVRCAEGFLKAPASFTETETSP